MTGTSDGRTNDVFQSCSIRTRRHQEIAAYHGILSLKIAFCSWISKYNTFEDLCLALGDWKAAKSVKLSMLSCMYQLPSYARKITSLRSFQTFWMPDTYHFQQEKSFFYARLTTYLYIDQSNLTLPTGACAEHVESNILASHTFIYPSTQAMHLHSLDYNSILSLSSKAGAL